MDAIYNSAACEEKLSFPSRRLATQKLNQMRRYRNSSSNPPTRVYLCPECNQYHLAGQTDRNSHSYKRKYRRRKYRPT